MVNNKGRDNAPILSVRRAARRLPESVQRLRARQHSLRLRGRRHPEQSGRFPGLFLGGLKCPGRTDACARSPLSRLAPHNLTLNESKFHDEIASTIACRTANAGNERM